MTKAISNAPCRECSKAPRYDYDGYCMDCADARGLTELSYLEKARAQGLITAAEFKQELADLLRAEPILLGTSEEE